MCLARFEGETMYGFLQTVKSALIVYTFISLHCYCDVKVFDNVGAVLELVSLTTKACKYTSLCTLSSDNDATNQSDEFTNTCCRSCSCEKDCINKRTCCPDFKLSQALGGIKFETFNDLVSAVVEAGVENITEALKFDAEDDDENNLEGSYSGVETQCRRARVSSDSSLSRENGMYQMISKCSDPSTTFSRSLECEKPGQGFRKPWLWDFIPVQSLASGRIYSNVYCFNCSQEKPNAVAEPWDIYMTSRTHIPEIFRDVIVSLDDILTRIINTKATGYDIKFQQSPKQQNLRQAVSCEAVDMKSCSTPGATRPLMEACENFVSPIYTNINGTTQVFNNIACISCRGLDIQEVMATCSRHGDWREGLLFTAIFNLKLESLDASFGRISRRPDVVDSTQRNRSCQQGFVFDKQEMMCRQLYCPCGMTLQNTTCLPIFAGITYAQFSVNLKVNPIDKSLATDHSFVKEYEQALSNYFHGVIDKNADFVLNSFTLWRCTSECLEDMDYFANIVFGKRNQTTDFLSVVKMIDKHYRGQQQLRLTDRTVAVELLVTDNMDILESSTTNVITEEKYSLVLSSGLRPSNVSKTDNIIPISECNFCYRIKLLDGEATGHPSGMIISESGRVVRNENMGHMYIDSSDEIVCAMYAFPAYETDGGKPDLAFTSWSDNNQDEVRTSQKQINSDAAISPMEKYILLGVLFSVVLALLIVVSAQVCTPLRQEEEETEHELSELFFTCS